MTINEWAARWGIPPEALIDLAESWTSKPVSTPRYSSEGAVQASVRLAAARAGWRLWRNNVGAGTLDNGSFVRWGLANESPAINARLKSADLIGLTPAGRFVSIECKHQGWNYNPNDEREAAQLAWLMLIRSMGGHAVFATGAEGLGLNEWVDKQKASA